jgi:hypothetical protein
VRLAFGYWLLAVGRNLAAEGEIDAIFDAQDAKYLKQIIELQDEKKLLPA